MSLSHNPHFTISAISTFSLANITVLGPVPAGIINAKVLAKVAGIINNKGFECPATAILAKTGKKILAVAVLEFSSVNKRINPTTITNTIQNGKELINAS
jgi:hypothetical protein